MAEPLCASCVFWWLICAVCRIQDDLDSLRHGMEKMTKQHSVESQVAVMEGLQPLSMTDTVNRSTNQ